MNKKVADRLLFSFLHQAKRLREPLLGTVISFDDNNIVLDINGLRTKLKNDGLVITQQIPVYVLTINEEERQIKVTKRLEETYNKFRRDYYDHARMSYPIGSLHTGRAIACMKKQEFRCVIDGHLMSDLDNIGIYLIDKKVVQDGEELEVQIKNIQLDRITENLLVTASIVC